MDKKRETITHEFVESAERFKSFLLSIHYWNKETKSKYYQLKNDYMEKRKLHAIDLGLDKVMEESMWPI